MSEESKLLLKYLRDEDNIMYAAFAAILKEGKLYVGGSYRNTRTCNPSYKRARQPAIARLSALLEKRKIPKNLALVIPDVPTFEKAVKILRALDIKITRIPNRPKLRRFNIILTPQKEPELT